jgi:hypothetical protein
MGAIEPKFPTIEPIQQQAEKSIAPLCIGLLCPNQELLQAIICNIFLEVPHRARHFQKNIRFYLIHDPKRLGSERVKAGIPPIL